MGAGRSAHPPELGEGRPRPGARRLRACALATGRRRVGKTVAKGSAEVVICLVARRELPSAGPGRPTVSGLGLASDGFASSGNAAACDSAPRRPARGRRSPSAETRVAGSSHACFADEPPVADAPGKHPGSCEVRAWPTAPSPSFRVSLTFKVKVLLVWGWPRPEPAGLWDKWQAIWLGRSQDPTAPRAALRPSFPDTGAAPQGAGAGRTHLKLSFTGPPTGGAAEDPGAGALAAWTFIHGCQGPRGPLGAPHNLTGAETLLPAPRLRHSPGATGSPGPCRPPGRGPLRTRDGCSPFEARRGRVGTAGRGGGGAPPAGSARPWEFAS